MPTNFWRNEQMLNIFRTKPCQRLARDGVCRWRSQCQYSHCPEWPRRQPRKYAYSPELCPLVRATEGADGGPAQVESLCPAGLNCPKAHSKEEVLFHPHFFKTSLCKEHASQSIQRNSRSSRGSRRHRCHRYYCPFAHGSEELRSSPLTQEQRDHCMQTLNLLPSDECCNVCMRYWLAPCGRAEDRSLAAAAVLNLEPRLPFPWPQQPQQPQHGAALPPSLGPVGPNWAPLTDTWGEIPDDHEEPKEEHSIVPALKDNFLGYSLTAAYKPMDVGRDRPYIQDKVGNTAWGDLQPAFVDDAYVGSSAESSQLEKDNAATRARELLGSVVYAML